ncbi:MAG: pilin [Candidatus Nealsonbacteria bacterium]
MKKNIILLLIFPLILILFFPLIVNGQGTEPRALELEYPSFPPEASAPTSTTSLPDFVKYIFVFAIIISGFIALLVIVYAGFEYTASIGSPNKIQSAKDKINGAIIGLLILAVSWLILDTINPQLVIFRLPSELPSAIPDISPGVYLCSQRVDILGFWQKRQQAEREEGTTQKQTFQELTGILKTIEQYCAPTNPVQTSGDISSDIEDKIQYVYLVPSFREAQYGAILYEERGFQGKSSVFYGTSTGSGGVSTLDKPTEWPVRNIQASSARVFILNFNPAPSWEARLFELVHFNRDDIKGKKTPEACKPGEQGSSTATGNCQIPKNKDNKNEVGSVNIEGSMFVIFLKEGGDWTSSSDNYIQANPGNTDLNNTVMGTWKREECVEKREPELRDRYYPCAERGVVVGADFY